MEQQRQMLKKISLFLLFFAVGGFALGYYYWKQFVQVPQWYAEQQLSSSSSSDAIASPSLVDLQAKKAKVMQNVEQQIDQQSDRSKVEVQFDRQDLNDLIVTSIAENPQGQKLLQATRGIQTNIDPDKLEIGAIVNPQALSDTALKKSEKAALGRVMQEFPGLSDREVYIGIESQPRIENGRIQIDDNARIKVGNLSFTVREISDKLGISPDKVLEKINQNLDFIDASEVQLEEDGLRVKGSAK